MEELTLATVLQNGRTDDVEINELKPNDTETYTLVPYSMNLISFRDIEISKILFYSNSSSLQIFYPGNNNYPNLLFSGNILNIYKSNSDKTKIL